jgi:hypothetical protein
MAWSPASRVPRRNSTAPASINTSCCADTKSFSSADLLQFGVVGFKRMFAQYVVVLGHLPHHGGALESWRNRSFRTDCVGDLANRFVRDRRDTYRLCNSTVNHGSTDGCQELATGLSIRHGYRIAILWTHSIQSPLIRYGASIRFAKPSIIAAMHSTESDAAIAIRASLARPFHSPMIIPDKLLAPIAAINRSGHPA